MVLDNSVPIFKVGMTIFINVSSSKCDASEC